jgi:hypothetical protein
MEDGMTFYRKKLVVIEALQWDGTKSGKNRITDAFPGINTVGQSGYIHKDEMTDWRIATLEGSHQVSPSDYIIKGVKGEFYPCKPDIFEMTYEVAETQEPKP